MQKSKIISSMLAFGIPMTINLASIIIFTRTLSLFDYGKLSLIWVTIEFLANIMFGWCKMGMVRFYDSSKKSLIVGIQICLVIVVTLLIVVLILYILDISDGADSLLIHRLILIGIISRGVAYFIQDFQKIDNSTLTRYTIVSFLVGLAYYGPAILFTLHRETIEVEEIVSIQVLCLSVFVALFSVSPILNLRKHLLKKGDPAVYKQFMNYALPLLGGFIAIGMFTRVDRFVIERVLGFEQLGIYSAAFNLSNLAISSLFSVMTISTYPEIIRKLNVGDSSSAIAIFRNNGNLILIFMPLVILISCLLSNVLCSLFFGEKANEIVGVFPIVLVMVYLFNFKVHYFDQIYQFSKKTYMSMWLSLSLGTGHLVFSYLIGSRLGLLGVILSSVILNVIAIIFTYFVSLRSFKIEFKRSTLAINVILTTLILFYLFNY